MTLDSKAIPLGRRTTREITIESFRGLGKLTLPKGTLIIVKTDVGKIDGASILVDAYIRPDAVFYGVRIEADDVEPPIAAPALPQT